MKITFLGHSSFYIETDKTALLLDPFISQNPMAAHIDVETLKPEWILLSHGHADHVADAEYIAKDNDAKIISNYEIVEWYKKKGIKGHSLNHGGKATFNFGTVKYVNAIHTSSMPDGSYGGNPGGFVIWDDYKTFYFAGDTALTMDMKLIPLTCGPLDFAILPIGDNYTMGYEDASIAAEYIKCKKIIGCHYNTFGYISIDKQKALKCFSEKGLELILPEIGSTIEL
jgi:L-ascorbate metabolism protein UlaG (beta-lactamase superfamily)